jgi:hypothetical protein
MTDPGEKAVHAPQLFGTPNPTSTGAPGTAGHGSPDPGEVPAVQNVFGTTVDNNTGSPGTGSSSGQPKADSKTVSHTVDAYGSDPYSTTTSTGGTAPSYQPIVGTYPTDTGAGEGHLLIGGRHTHQS